MNISADGAALHGFYQICGSLEHDLNLLEIMPVILSEQFAANLNSITDKYSSALDNGRSIQDIVEEQQTTGELIALVRALLHAIDNDLAIEEAYAITMEEIN